MMFLMLKANDMNNYGARENWYYQSTLTDDDDWKAFEREAEAICASKGWSLINVRPVPRDTALDRIERQAR